MGGEIEVVTETVLANVACSKGFNFANRKALWDSDKDMPILCPAESPEPLIGWAALDAYWSQSRETMSSLESKATNIRIRLVNDKIALATYQTCWIATLTQAGHIPEKPLRPMYV